MTIEELRTISNKDLIIKLISERRKRLHNPYVPLYQRLSELEQWVKENVK